MNDKINLATQLFMMATKDSSGWFTDSPIFHSDAPFGTMIEAVLLDGSCFYGKLDAEEEYWNDGVEEGEYLSYYLYRDFGFVDFSEIKKWRVVV